MCCTVYGGLCTVYGVCLMYAPSSRGRPGSTRGANPERNWKRSFPIGPSRIWGTNLDHVPLPHIRPVERKKRGHLAVAAKRGSHALAWGNVGYPLTTNTVDIASSHHVQSVSMLHHAARIGKFYWSSNALGMSERSAGRNGKEGDWTKIDEEGVKR